MTTLILLSALALALGLSVGFLWAHTRSAALRTQRDEAAVRAQMLEQQIAEIKETAETGKQELRTDYEQRLANLRQQHAEQLNELRKQQTEQAAAQAALVREQINNASQEILKERAKELSSTNEQQLGALLNPLQESLKLMREAVAKSDREQGIALERLQAFIEANRKQSAELGEQADRLAQALTGENKVQGNFGELHLRTLLQKMDLKEGVEFEEQKTLSDESGRTLHDEESGRRLVPDVVLHFPGNRDVVIDSKMSLKAFTDYCDATTPAERSNAQARHIASVRAHVKELAGKDYSRYVANGKAKIDFVVMYIYNESALQLALTGDARLWREANDQGVVITGSQNLYMMLRVLEMTWRQVRQARNQENIIKLANELVNRVQLFNERFGAVSDQLDKTQKAFAELGKSVASGGRGIVGAAQKLVEYGASENPKRKLRLPKASEPEPDEAE